MAIAEAYFGSAAIAAEWSLPNNAAYNAGTPITADGIYEALINLSPLAAGDAYRVRVYEKCVGAGAGALLHDRVYSTAQAEPLLALQLGMLLHGWDVTVEKIYGTTRTIEWSIRSVT